MRGLVARLSVVGCAAEPRTDNPRMKKLMLKTWLVLVALPLGAFASHFPFFEPLDPPRAVQVMQHRGASGQAPENTRPALVRCIQDGFEWVEVDVRLSRDGRHVLGHDPKLDRLGREGTSVKDLNLEELETLDAGGWFAQRYQGERLLTLRDALELAKGKINLYLDCKDVDLALLAREILEAGMEKQVVVYENPERLRALRAIAENKIARSGRAHV